MAGTQNQQLMAPDDSIKPVNLVVLPGLDGTEVFFRPFLAALPASVRARVVVYPPDGPHDYVGLLAHVQREVADLESFHVLGSSFGGPLATMLAAGEPQRVRGLILCASFVRSPRPALHRYRHAAAWPVVGALRAARRVPVWLGRSQGRSFRHAKAETWTRVPARSLAARLRSVIAVDAREALLACAQPIAYVRYEADGVVLPASFDEVLKLKPELRCYSLPGAHLGMHADGAALARVVSEFVGEGPEARACGAHPSP